MSATTKPPRRPALAPASRVEVPVLTPAEAQLLQAFRTINDRQQQNMVRSMSAAAQRFPRIITRPALRLITGGTK